MSIVGRITETDHQPGKTLITIDDTTGSLTVQVNKRFDQSEPRILQGVNLNNNKYIKVIMNVNRYKDELVFMGIHLSTITNGEAVTEHNLRSVLCQKHRKFGALRDEVSFFGLMTLGD
jgi:RPA family protein